MYVPSTFLHIMSMYMYNMIQFEINHLFIHSIILSPSAPVKVVIWTDATVECFAFVFFNILIIYRDSDSSTK